VDDVEPIPETREALRRLSEVSEGDLGRDLQQAGTILSRRVTGLVAFSISVVRGNLTFTYVASAAAAAGLDAMQYLGGGPCEQAIREKRPMAVDHRALFDEGRWQLFARAGSAYGIASTLSMPIIDDDEVVGGVNVYGSAGDTFDGRHEELARLFGAWAPGAVTNADLLFRSRLEALQTLDRLEDMSVVDVAVGLLAKARGIPLDRARQGLARAAGQAGISVAEAARLVVRGEAPE
jgi:GAF domain-containing protein